VNLKPFYQMGLACAAMKSRLTNTANNDKIRQNRAESCFWKGADLMNILKNNSLILGAIGAIFVGILLVATLGNGFDSQGDEIDEIAEMMQAHTVPLSLEEVTQVVREMRGIDVYEVARLGNFHFYVPEEFILAGISGMVVEFYDDTLVFRAITNQSYGMMFPQHLNDRALDALATMLVETGQLRARLTGRDLMSWLDNNDVEVSYFGIPFRRSPW